MASPQNSKSSLSVVSEDQFDMKFVSKTNGCLSHNISSKPSASVIYKKQNVYNQGTRISSLIPASTEVRQKVLSARRLKIKTYQNQLAEAKQTIEDLLHENRLLQTLHKRQDTALAKYESSNAELPQLLNSHSEELRMWQSKYKHMQITNKELEQKIKQKESIILSLTDQNRYYSQLNKDKSLLERHQMREENEKISKELKAKDAELKNLRKKMDLEIKNLKQQVISEQKKTRNALGEIEKYRLEINAFTKLDQMSISNKMPSKPAKSSLKESLLAEGVGKIPLECSTGLKNFESISKQDKSCKKVKLSVDTEQKIIKKLQKEKSHEASFKIQEVENTFHEHSQQNFQDVNVTIKKTPPTGDSQDEFSETDFNTKRMQSNITNVRSKVLGSDFNKREEFIDEFCLQSSVANHHTENDEMYNHYTRESNHFCSMPKNMSKDINTLK